MEQKPGGASCAPAPRKERVTALANVCAVKMENITKRFGKVTANKDVTLELYKGEILSLLGENGSGKTTLMNMLSGIYFPDEGQIYIDGKPVTIASPKDAFALGIGMIHQHFKLVDVFTATENIILGMPGKLNLAEARKKVQEICDRYGFDIDPDQKIYDMSVSQKQTVEIVKVLYRGANILILDEPTAVLTPQETDKLFAVMRNMKNDGKSLIIITHKLHEVLDVSDRVAVLRKGEYIGCVQTKDANQQSLTDMMVGHAVTLNIDRPTPVNVKPRLDIKGLTVFDEMGVKRLDNVTFTANAGEVLGIAGIAGSGQRELLESIAGLYPVASGSVTYYNPDDDQPKELVGLSPMAIRKSGIAMSFVPEDRLGMGLVGSMGMTGNMMLRSWRKGGSIFLDRKDPEAPGQPHLAGAGGGDPQHQLPRAPHVRRQRAEGAGGPRDRPAARRADDGLRRPRPGHQHLLYHLQSADRAEDEGRGRGVCGRGSGRAAGAVRPDRGSVRRSGLRRGRRPDH